MCTCSIIDDSCADEEQNIAYTQLVLIFSMMRAHEYVSQILAGKMPAYATQRAGPHANKKGIKKAPTGANMVGDEGFEPPTLCV